MRAWEGWEEWWSLPFVSDRVVLFFLSYSLSLFLSLRCLPCPINLWTCSASAALQTLALARQLVEETTIMKRISTIVISYLFALTFLQCMNQLQYSASIISSTWASLNWNPNSTINFLARADFVNNASQSAFPMTRSPRHHLNRHYTTYTYNETWEMNRFFNVVLVQVLTSAKVHQKKNKTL